MIIVVPVDGLGKIRVVRENVDGSKLCIHIRDERNAVRSAAIEVLVQRNSKKILGCRCESRLLGTSVHGIREGDLNGTAGPVIRVDRVCTLSALLIIRRGEGLRL